MRIETTERELYKFDELTDDAKEKVYDYFFSANLEDWSILVDEYFQDWAKEEGEKIGISFDKVYYDIGRANYLCLDKPCFDDLKLFIDQTEMDTKTKTILFERCDLTIEQGRSLNTLELNTYVSEAIEGRIEDRVEHYLKPKFEAFVDSLMSYLKEEETYITSREYIKEQVEANEYEFTIDGKLA